MSFKLILCQIVVAGKRLAYTDPRYRGPRPKAKRLGQIIRLSDSIESVGVRKPFQECEKALTQIVKRVAASLAAAIQITLFRIETVLHHHRTMVTIILQHSVVERLSASCIWPAADTVIQLTCKDWSIT